MRAFVGYSLRDNLNWKKKGGIGYSEVSDKKKSLFIEKNDSGNFSIVVCYQGRREKNIPQILTQVLDRN